MMNKHLEQMAIGILSTVAMAVPFLVLVVATSLSSDVIPTIAKWLPLAVTMGAIIGLVTSFMHCDGCLVLVGASVGWYFGAILTALVSHAFGLPEDLTYVVLLILGVLFGLMPSWIARIRMGE